MTVLAVLAVHKGWKILDTFKENENDGFGGSDPYPIFGCFWERWVIHACRLVKIG